MTITAEPTAPPTTDGNPEVNPLVRIVELEGRMFAYRAGTGTVLAEAARSNGHNDSEWIGWAIWAAGRKTQVVETGFLARHILTEYAHDAVGGGR